LICSIYSFIWWCSHYHL